VLLLLLLLSFVMLQIAAGEPLLLSYGKLSNDFLLMDYGFVVPGNEHDRVALRFDIELVKVRG
jgi:histone-lysine N-methyltransferase SETD3